MNKPKIKNMKLKIGLPRLGACIVNWVSCLTTLGACLVTWVGCNHGDPAGVTPVGVVPVSFSASMNLSKEAPSRTVNDVWTGNETVGVVAYSATDGSNYTDGFRKYVPTGVSGAGCSLVPASGEERIDYPMNGPGLLFTAFSPWPSDADVKSGVSSMSGSTVTYNLHRQSVETDIMERLDFIHFRGADEYTWRNPEVTLNFAHKLSRIRINLKSSDSSVDLSNASATILGVPLSVSANIETGAITLSGEGSITAERVSAGSSLATFRAMVAPQDTDSSPSAIYRKITFAVSGKYYTIRLIDDFVGGYTYTLDATYIDPEVVLGNVSVSPWDEQELSPSAVASEENCYIIPPGGELLIPVSRAIAFATTVEGKAESAPILAAGEEFYTKVYWTDNASAIALKGEADTSTQIYSIGSGPYGHILVRPGSEEGNALLALQKKNGDGTFTTLWSWHLWITGYEPTGKWMDRNLGAMSSEPPKDNTDVSSVGLLYQWGRKDPFPGTNTLAGTTGTLPDWFTWQSAAAGSGSNIKAAVQHPATFLIDANWEGTNGAGSWGAQTNTKTIYDPCPSGYRVPAPDTWGSDDWTSNQFSWYHTNYGGHYPLAGYLMSTGKFEGVGSNAIYLSSTSDLSLYITSGNVHPEMSLNIENFGAMVRCVKIE